MHDPHRQELEDAILHVVETVVVLVQDAGRVGEVEAFLAHLAPGQFADRLDVGADDLGLHRLAAHALQAPELTVDFLAGRFRQLQVGDAVLEFLEIVRAVVVTQFLADRLQLLAEVHLALAVAKLLLDLGVDVLLGVEDLDPPLDERQYAAHPLLDRQGLEQGLVVVGREFEMSRHQVGELSGVADRAQRLRDDVVRDTGAGAQLGGAVSQFLVEGDEGEVLRVDRQQFLRRRHGGREVLVALLDAQHDAAVESDDDRLGAAQAVLELDDPGDDADRVQAEGVHFLALLALEQGEERTFGMLGGGLDRAQRVGPSDLHRHRDSRIDDQVAEDDDGQLRHGRLCPRGQRPFGQRLFLGRRVSLSLVVLVPVVGFSHVSSASRFGAVVVLSVRRNGAGAGSYSISLRSYIS